jgi:hypothetical protein
MNTCPLSPPRGLGCVGPSPTDLVSKLRHEAAARCIGEKALYAACKAEGINTSKERIVHGHWLWALETTPGASELEESTLPSP